MPIPTHPLRGLIILALCLLPMMAQASSKIFDGVILEVDGDTIVVRVAHSPYSSVTSHGQMMTHRDGTYTLQRCSISRFLTYYIDEVPVTEEQMRAVLRPGLRMVMMVNRDRWYFLSVTARGNDNQLGFLRAIDDNTLTLERPQISGGSVGVFSRGGGRVEEDGFTHLTFDRFPHRQSEVVLADDAVVVQGGETMPWREANLTPDPAEDHADPRREGSNSGGAGWTEPTRSVARRALSGRRSILVQAAREHMRIELMPPGYGDWETLVASVSTMGDYRHNPGMRYQYLAIATSPVRTETVNTRAPQTVEANNGERKFKESTVFDFVQLAGGYPSETPAATAAIYYKGGTAIVDGFYTSDMRRYNDRPNGFCQPGRIMVCFQRRQRITSDRFAFSSESPIAWGTITAIDGNTVTIEAPEIPDVPVSGVQTIEIPADSTAHHLGQDIARDDALQVGHLVHIFAARPQTVLVDDGR